MIVVALRAYSRMRGLTSLESATYVPGASSAMSSRTRCSWAGARKLHSRDTAMASAPASTSSRIARRVPSSSSGTISAPLWSIRSSISRTSWGGTSGWGLLVRTMSCTRSDPSPA
jgi:hypothetical protein